MARQNPRDRQRNDWNDEGREGSWQNRDQDRNDMRNRGMGGSRGGEFDADRRMSGMNTMDDEGDRGFDDGARSRDRNMTYGGGRESNESRREGRPFEGQDYGGSGWNRAREGWRGGREMHGGSWGGSGSNAGFGRERDEMGGHSGWGEHWDRGPGEGSGWGTGGGGMGWRHAGGNAGSAGMGQSGMGQPGGTVGWNPGNRFGPQGQFGNAGGWDRDEQQRRGRHFGRGPKGYMRSDERVREDVSEMLYRHDEVDASEIEVQVKEGDVTLTGSVESRESRRMAEECVWDVSGVKNVTNMLRIDKDGRDREAREVREETTKARRPTAH